MSKKKPKQYHLNIFLNKEEHGILKSFCKKHALLMSGYVKNTFLLDIESKQTKEPTREKPTKIHFKSLYPNIISLQLTPEGKYFGTWKDNNNFLLEDEILSEQEFPLLYENNIEL